MENRMYTTNEIAEMLIVPKSQVQNAINVLEIIARGRRVETRTKSSEFDAAQTDVICKYIKWGCKRNMTPAQFASLQTEVEKIQGTVEAEHPLVTDKRCLKMNYWPNTVPKYFEDIDDEEAV